MNRKYNSVISGFGLTLIRAGVGLTLLRVGLGSFRNPVTAVASIKSLLRERIRLHGNAGGKKAVRSGSKYYWSINIPGWPSDNFSRFIENEFLRISEPSASNLQTLIFAITNVCPLNCIHCYEAENLSARNDLSAEDLKVIMTHIINKGIRHIHFSGGEPLSRFDDMVSLMKLGGKDFEYWINTSGYGLTPGKAAEMKKYGMTGAIISLDHWDEAMHNAFRRNKDSFYWVREAAKNCNSEGIIVCLSVCATREFVTEENLARIHETAREFGAGFIRILEPRQEGRFAGKDVTLKSSHIDVIHKFISLRNNISRWSSYPVIQYAGHHSRKYGCLGAGNRYIYIDPKGNYHSCPFCRNALGNALKNSLSEGIAMAKVEGCHAFRTRKLA